MISSTSLEQFLPTSTPKGFADGEADGAFGYPPAEPDNDSYWSGYVVGLRSFWRLKAGRTGNPGGKVN